MSSKDSQILAALESSTSLPIFLQVLASLIDLQLLKHPRYAIAAHIHRTETEEKLTFDATTDWQVAILQDESDNQVFMKCSQVGITVLAIIMMMHWQSMGLPGIYVLPSKVVMEQFVKNRLDPILNQVPYYKRHYAPRKEDAQGSALKTLFRRRVKFVGSNVKNAFFEMPAGYYIIDEMDLCEAKNLKFLEDRLGRQKRKRWMKIGNPSHEKRGIHAEFLASDQKEWMIECTHCGAEQPLDWNQNAVRQVGKRRFVLRDRKVQAKLNQLRRTNSLEIAGNILMKEYELTGQDARIYCAEVDCQKPIDRHGPGRWVAKHPERPVSGYHINKMFGDPHSGAILRMYLSQMVGIHDPARREHFANNILGRPYSETGNRITEELLASCVQDYEMPFRLNRFDDGKNMRPTQILQHDFTWTTAGCDVGNSWHTQVSGIYVKNYQVYRIKLFVGQLDGPEALHDVCKRFNVTSGVIDAMPETRLARKFAKEHPGWVICWYTDNKKELQPDKKQAVININRTEALDGSLAEYDAGHVILPMNWRSLDGGDFVEGMTSSERQTDPETGKITWSQPDNDHHRHSDTYDWLASRLPGASTWAGAKGRV